MKTLYLNLKCQNSDDATLKVETVLLRDRGKVIGVAIVDDGTSNCGLSRVLILLQQGKNAIAGEEFLVIDSGICFRQDRQGGGESNWIELLRFIELHSIPLFYANKVKRYTNPLKTQQTIEDIAYKLSIYFQIPYLS